MAVRYSYLALEDDHRLVVEWFSQLPDKATSNDRADRLLLYFRDMARHPLASNGEIDQEKTPLVFIQKPQRKRGTLWTNAEVYFSATPLQSQFPWLHKISKAFAAWLDQFDLVFSQRDAANGEWNYYLEGSIQSVSPKLFALPQAMKALRSGQYFVHHRESDGRLDTLAKTLRLRGYEVEPA